MGIISGISGVSVSLIQIIRRTICMSSHVTALSHSQIRAEGSDLSPDQSQLTYSFPKLSISPNA